MSVERRVTFGEHFYQPPRFASHEDLSGIEVHPGAVDWNEIITDQCYGPQIEGGLLNKTAFDFYGVLRAQIKLSPDQSEEIKQAMKERGVGDPWLHPILPDLNQRDRELLLKAGSNEFYRDCGRRPRWLWPPETALDTPTLRDAKNAGYQGVICAPEQLSINGNLSADNKIVKLPIGNNGSDGHILACAFDRPVSTAFAFGDKANADSFADDVIVPRLKSLPEDAAMITWTDGETFGHHDRYAHLFLSWLIFNSLPERNIHPVSLQQALEQIDLEQIPEAQLKERTAWSCPHGNLVRWNGECECGGSGHKSWKAPFIHTLRSFNNEVDTILDNELPRWPDLLAENFSYYFMGKFLDQKSSPDDYLLMAKASSLAGLTSCATFFTDVHTSGRYNILFVLQACRSLISAGLTQQGKNLEANFRSRLEQLHDEQGRSLSKIIDGLLAQT